MKQDKKNDKTEFIYTDRKLLNKRLEALAEAVEEDVKEDPNRTCYFRNVRKGVVMCYRMPSGGHENFKCNRCGRITEYPTDYLFSLRSIRECVNNIIDLGYDATLDESEFCSYCKVTIGGFINYVRNFNKPQLIFRIRLSENEKYHEAKSNNTSDYRWVLRFLRGDFTDLHSRDSLFFEDGNLFTDYYTRGLLVLEKMLGLERGTNLKKYLEWSKKYKKLNNE